MFVYALKWLWVRVPLKSIKILPFCQYTFLSKYYNDLFQLKGRVLTTTSIFYRTVLYVLCGQPIILHLLVSVNDKSIYTCLRKHGMYPWGFCVLLTVLNNSLGWYRFDASYSLNSYQCFPLLFFHSPVFCSGCCITLDNTV